MSHLSLNQKTLLAILALLLISLPITLHDAAMAPLLNSASGQSSEPSSSDGPAELSGPAPLASGQSSEPSSSAPAESPGPTPSASGPSSEPSSTDPAGLSEPSAPAEPAPGESSEEPSPVPRDSYAPVMSFEVRPREEPASVAEELPDSGEPSMAASSQPTRTIHVVRLKYGAAADVATMIGQLYFNANIVADERTNSLLVQVEGPKLPKELMMLFEQLDRPAATQTSGSFSTSKAKPPYGTSLPEQISRRQAAMLNMTRARSTRSTVSAAGDGKGKLQYLRQRYAEAEQESLRLAAEHARLTQTEGESNAQADLDKLTEQLDRSVHTAFDRRQALQEAEVAQLRERLKSLESKLQARNELKGRIIARRMEDLLNPNQRWDPEGSPGLQLPRPPEQSLHLVPRPAVAIPSPAKPPLSTGLPPRTSYAPSDPQFQMELQLIEVTPQVAEQLELPSDAGKARDHLTRKRADFNARVERVGSPDQIRILAEPSLATTLGRKAVLQTRGQSGDDKSDLSVEVNPIRFEKGRLTLSVNVSYQEQLTSDASEDYKATDRKTHRIQTQLELSPSELVIAGPWKQDASDRLVFLIVHAKPVHVPQIELPDLPPSASGHPPGPMTRVPRVAIPTSPYGAILMPTGSESWSRKLPSDYLGQRQKIISDITEIASQSWLDDEVTKTRLHVLADQAARQLHVLALEFAGQMEMCKSELIAQEASLSLAKEELGRLSELFEKGVVSTSELAKAQANLERAAAAHRQAENILNLFHSSREAIIDEHEPMKIIDQFRRAEAEERAKDELPDKPPLGEMQR